MTKESNNTENATDKKLSQSLMINVLEIIDKKMFTHMSASECNESLDTVFTDWLTSTNADDHQERGQVVAAFQIIKKLLKSIGSHQDPSSICSIEINTTF